MSASKDLQHDARRDLDDIGAQDIPSQALSDMDYGKIKPKEGRAFFLSSDTLSENIHPIIRL